MIQKTNKPKYQSNILEFQTDGNDNNDLNQQDDFKNQYSTFIEELEETTQKLMNQVFNAEYKGEPHYDDDEDQLDDRKDGKYVGKGGRNVKQGSRITMNNYKTGGFTTLRNNEDRVEGTQSFQNFITRNYKWCEKKQSFITKQIKKKELLQQKQVTGIPQILRGSIQKLQPIYERAIELHASKQKKRAYKRIEQKRKQDEEINSYPFHPQIISKAKSRTLQQYLQDKQQWQKRRNEARQVRKLKQEAEKYSECSFTPNLVSKKIDEKTLRIKPGQKVQERLLRSLEKAFAEI